MCTAVVTVYIWYQVLETIFLILAHVGLGAGRGRHGVFWRYVDLDRDVYSTPYVAAAAGSLGVGCCVGGGGDIAGLV